MNENIALFEYNPLQLILISVASALFLCLVFWWIYKLRHPSMEKRVEKTIKETSEDYLKDVVLSDGLYGYHFIDYLVLLPGRILVLGLQTFDGYIFGGDKIEEWAQVLNNRSYNFDNPLLNTSHYVQSIQELADHTEIVGRVMFTSDCSFPKGIPDGIIEKDNLQSALENLKKDNADLYAMQSTWEKLTDICQQQKSKYLKDK